MQNVNDFLNESNPFLGNNALFHDKQSHRKKQLVIYVEGLDDVTFYKHFLRKILTIGFDEPSFSCLGNKKAVLCRLREDKSTRNFYIVDSDYDYRQKLINAGAIVTTGYSMENFFFYIDDNCNNFEKILSKIYNEQKVLGTENDFISEITNKIKKFYDNNLVYYAYMKTLHSMGKNWSMNVKNSFLNDDGNYIDIINDELNALNDYEKNKIVKKMDENLEELKSSNYMLIKGHDLFDKLSQFLNESLYIFHDFDIKEFVLLNGYLLNIPDDFKKQFK